MNWHWVWAGAELAWTVLSVATALAALLAAGHVVVHKRDTRSAVGWVGLIVLVPLLGTMLYLVLGINRIRRRAAALRAQQRALPGMEHGQDDRDRIDAPKEHLRTLATLMRNVTGEPLLDGHRVQALENGDEAYPQMLAAIDRAQHCICMSTYIFETDGPGALFIDALTRAHARGVQVRVLIDGVGARYGRGRADRVLRERGVRTALFLPMRGPAYSRYYNLRNHRKLLVVDGRDAFTGGINVRQGHVLKEHPKSPIRDVHFALRGPISGWLTRVFAEDWEFTTGESLHGEPWFVPCPPAGSVLARGVVDGPDADLDKVRWTLMGALSCARDSVRVVTPYFLPDSPLMSALNVAALRGLKVDVVLPERGNLRLVSWAMQGHLAHQTQTRVNYWLSPPPFDHSKLMVVDEAWSLIGSANWDPRSLRLNFEVAVECYDIPLAQELARQIDRRIDCSRRLTAEHMTARPLAVRLRDGLARLLTPYL